MFPSVPPFKVAASFSLSMVHAGVILSQLVANQAGDPKDNLDDEGAKAATNRPAASALAQADDEDAAKDVKKKIDRDAPAKTAARPSSTGEYQTRGSAPPRRRPVTQRGHRERIDHMGFDQEHWPAKRPWFTVPEMREQLRMDGNQFDNLTGTYSRLWSRYNDVMSKYPDNLARAQQFMYNEIALNHFQGDLNTAVDQILSEPYARNRFKQLDWQYKLYDSFNDPVVRSKLKLTDDQLLELNLDRRNWNRQLLEYQAAYNQKPEVVTKKFLDSRIEAQEKIKSVLTPEQEILWNELLGEPYNFGFDTYYGPATAP
jgi:hypothetical protein